MLVYSLCPKLVYIEVKWVKVTQSCPTLCDPMDYTVHGIFQARILEWVAFPSSRGSSQPWDRTQVSRIAGRWILYQLSHKGRPRILEWVAYPFSRRSSWVWNHRGLHHCRWILYQKLYREKNTRPKVYMLVITTLIHNWWISTLK